MTEVRSVHIDSGVRQLIIDHWMSECPSATDADRAYLEKALQLPQKTSDFKKWLSAAFLWQQEKTKAA